jgi:hypothetical protein
VKQIMKLPTTESAANFIKNATGDTDHRLIRRPGQLCRSGTIAPIEQNLSIKASTTRWRRNVWL